MGQTGEDHVGPGSPHVLETAQGIGPSGQSAEVLGIDLGIGRAGLGLGAEPGDAGLGMTQEETDELSARKARGP